MSPIVTHRLSLERCRQILGPAAADLSAQELENLRDRLYSVAGVLVRSSIKTIKQSRKAA